MKQETSFGNLTGLNETPQKFSERPKSSELYKKEEKPPKLGNEREKKKKDSKQLTYKPNSSSVEVDIRPVLKEVKYTFTNPKPRLRKNVNIDKLKAKGVIIDEDLNDKTKVIVRNEIKTKQVDALWYLPTLNQIIQNYNESHRTIIDDKYYLSTFTTPKILPKFLGEIIFTMLNNRYTTVMNNYLTYLGNKLNELAYDLPIPCFILKEDGTILNGSENFKSNNNLSGLTLFERINGMYIDDNECRLFIDNLNLTKIFEIFRLDRELTYNTRGFGVFKTTNETRIIRDAMNKFLQEKEYKKIASGQYLLFDDITDEEIKSELFTFYTTTNSNKRKELKFKYDGLIRKVLTVKLLRKNLPNLLFTGGELIYRDNNIKGTVSMEYTKERITQIINYYSYMTHTLNKYIVYYLGINFKPKQRGGKRIGKKLTKKKINGITYNDTTLSTITDNDKNKAKTILGIM